MSGAPDGLGRFNIELLMRNKFYIGVKRGKEYVCGDNANEDAKSKAVELLSEAIKRILRWRVWETQWIEETMDEWLIARDKLELQLREKYSDDVINDLLGMVDKFIGYNEQFLNHWHDVGDEVRRLIDNLMSGKAEAIIWEGEKGISVHGNYITLEVERTNTGGVTVQLKLSGLESVTIKAPDMFRKTMSRKEYKKFVEEVLKALRGGLEETDGTIKDGKAGMDTTQMWQVVVWALLYFGRMYVRISSINVNGNNVTITWHLRSSHDPLKGKILNNADKLSEEGLLALMFTAILGDGSADIAKVVINGRVYDEAVIGIAMSDEEFKRWEPLFERLKNMGFRSGKPNLINSNVVVVPFYGSNAIDLARAMINVLPPILRDVLDALGFEKWVNMRRIAEIELKWRRGESQVIVAGYKFTVHVREGDVRLVHWARDEVEKDEVIDALKARYGDGFTVNVHKSGEHLDVVIPMYVFEKYDDIRRQVIEMLCRKLEKTKDEKKRQIIIKHLRRLASTEGAAAVASQVVKHVKY